MKSIYTFILLIIFGMNSNAHNELTSDQINSTNLLIKSDYNSTVLESPYYSVDVSIKPKYYNFGTSYKIGDPPEVETFTVLNQSEKDSVIIDSVYLANNSIGLKLDISELRIEQPFAPDEKRKLSVIFTPISEKTISDTIKIFVRAIGSDCTFLISSIVEANHNKNKIFVNNLSFPNQDIGSSSNYLPIEVLNTNTDTNDISLQITNINMTSNIGITNSNTVFHVNNFDSVSITNPIEIKPGENFIFFVNFTPDSFGDFEGKIEFEGNFTGEKDYTILKGTCIKNYSIKYCDLIESPIGYKLYKTKLEILNNSNKNQISVDSIRFSENFGELNSSETFKSNKIYQNRIVIPKESSQFIEIYSDIQDTNTHSGKVFMYISKEIDTIKINCKGYFIDAQIVTNELVAIQNSNFSEDFEINFDGNNKLYIYGVKYYGDAGDNIINSKISLSNKPTQENPIIIENGEKLTIIGNTSDIGDYSGKIELLSNSKNDLIFDINFKVQNDNSILDYKLLSSFNSRYDNKNDKIVIDMTSREIYHPEIQLIDMLGNKIFLISKHIMPGENRIEIDCSSLFSGTYLLNILNEGQPVASEKVVIVR